MVNDYIVTYKGHRFYYNNLANNIYDIEDIAHALSNTCRFGGHVKGSYNVAQHSILVSHWCPPLVKIYGLLHDAAEAYIGDIVTPFKNNLPHIREYEDELLNQIFKYLSIPLPSDQWWQIVKEQDLCALKIEKELFMHSDEEWEMLRNTELKFHDILNTQLSPMDSELMFLYLYNKLRKEIHK